MKKGRRDVPNIGRMQKQRDLRDKGFSISLSARVWTLYHHCTIVAEWDRNHRPNLTEIDAAATNYDHRQTLQANPLKFIRMVGRKENDVYFRHKGGNKVLWWSGRPWLSETSPAELSQLVRLRKAGCS